MARKSELVVAIAIVVLAGCEDDKKQRLIAQTASDAAPIPLPSVAPASASAAPSAGPPDAAGEAKRFNPSHKCPTGQTHFYLEGDFCRRKCVTNADCAKKERCSAIEYPTVVDGGPAGMAKFCEGAP